MSSSSDEQQQERGTTDDLAPVQQGQQQQRVGELAAADYRDKAMASPADAINMATAANPAMRAVQGMMAGLVPGSTTVFPSSGGGGAGGPLPTVLQQGGVFQGAVMNPDGTTTTTISTDPHGDAQTHSSYDPATNTYTTTTVDPASGSYTTTMTSGGVGGRPD